MPDTQEALLWAVCARPDDLDARLVYANWLAASATADNDFAARADFIRRNCAGETGLPWAVDKPLGFTPVSHFDPISGDLQALVRDGFVSAVRLPLELWLSHGRLYVAAYPIRRVELSHHYPRHGADGQSYWYSGAPTPSLARHDLGPDFPGRLFEHGTSRAFPSDQLAVETVSRCLVDYAREAAGLPRLWWNL